MREPLLFHRNVCERGPDAAAATAVVVQTEGRERENEQILAAVLGEDRKAFRAASA